ncbi:MAG TPA: helix-hairpin-helix domain-containing protein [Thermoanaerobaculia bacterium]|nr:helix-hairpin-helix domain-containing protein [Thermoanaerobaculia bacterium]
MHPDMDNLEIGRILAEVADILEIQGADSFRIRAYRNAIRTVEVQTRQLAELAAEGPALTRLPGIGKEMASHIREMLATGTLALRDGLLAEVPRSLVDLMRLPGVGPKKARKVWDELGIASVDELEAAGRTGRIAALPGFGARSQEKILAGIADFRQRRRRFLLSEAEHALEPLVAHLRASPELERLEVAGSYRRRCETVGDADLLGIAAQPEPVMERFLHHPQVAKVLMAGPTRSSVCLGSGLQVDLRVVPAECYGAALVYFTGSKEHNIKLRRRAVERGLRISEYGVFGVAAAGAAAAADAGDGAAASVAAPRPSPAGSPAASIAGREEADVYAAVGCAWIPPELREDRGEIEAAAAGRVPRLVETADLRGDLQMHSTWSDGRNTLAEMVAACAARGYEYMAITDHSKALAMISGLDARRLRLQWLEIDAVRARHPGIQLLRSLEVDILPDGSLDLEDEMLAGLDLVVASVHSRFELPSDQQTARILKALEHPEVNILAHPTGRLINRRKPIAFDLDAVLRRAAELGVAVELNSQPHRLDLCDTHLLRARDLGCKIVISTDSHRVQELALVRYGIDQARRAGLEPRHVLNTLPYSEFRQAIDRNGRRARSRGRARKGRPGRRPGM